MGKQSGRNVKFSPVSGLKIVGERTQEMDTQISKLSLQENRSVYLEEQKQQFIQRFVRRIVAAVIQESKVTDAQHYLFTDVTESGTSSAFPFKYMDQLLSSLRRAFPDCVIEYRKGYGVLIDWA